MHGLSTLAQINRAAAKRGLVVVSFTQAELKQLRQALKNQEATELLARIDAHTNTNEEI